MKFDPESTTIGFIGTGVMGKSMAGHLMQAGYKLCVSTRTKSRAQELLDNGAIWCETPVEIAKACQLVITMVGFPSDVEEVYLGERGLIPHAAAGTTFIDMTTSKPSLAEKIETEAKKNDMHVLDAPVSGGDIGAKEARLSIMVGGDKEVFDAVLPVFELMGKNIVYQGKAGSGQHTKMCNQITIASNMIGISEAMAYAKKAGLDPETVLESITGGAAGSWSLSNLAPRMLKGDFNPGFFVKHIIKDFQIALDESKRLGLRMEGLPLSKSLYEELAEKGGENDGTQALFKLFDDQN